MTHEYQSVTTLYQTQDLALATTISVYFPLEGVEKLPNSQKSVFFFKRSPELEQLVEAYWKRELKIEPQLYFAQLRLVKARLYETR